MSDVLMQGAATLLLVATAALVYWTFRQRFLLFWLLGWFCFAIHRETFLTADYISTPRPMMALSGVAFVLAITLFTVTILYYTESRNLIHIACVLAAIGVDAAIAQALWVGGAAQTTLFFQLTYHAIALIGVARLVYHTWGRREVAPWILAISLLATHMDSLGSLHRTFEVDALIEIALGISMVFLVLDDSRARSRRLGVVNNITTVLTEARDASGMMMAFLLELKNMMGASAAWFRTMDQDELTMQLQVGLPKEIAEDDNITNADYQLVSRLIRERGTARSRVSTLMPQYRDQFAAANIRHLLLLPVLGKATSLGVLTFGMPNARSYIAEEMRFLFTTANHLGIAVENLRMFEQLVRSQRQWSSTFASIEDFILVHDSEERIVKANRALLLKLGSSGATVTGRPCSEVLPNATAGCPYCIRAAQTAGEAPDPCFGGYSLVSTSSYIEEPGRESGTVHIIKDITERRAAEERYRLLFEEVQEGVFVSTPDGRILDCNSAFIRLLGYESRVEVLAVNAEDLFADPEQRRAYLWQVETYGSVRNYEITCRRKDGRQISVLENSLATRNSIGQVERIQGFLFDYTEKKLAEQEIRRRNRELRALNAIAVVATQTFDLDEILNVTLRHVVELFDTESGSILLMDGHGQNVRCRASYGEKSARALELMTESLPSQWWAKLLETGTELFTPRNLQVLPPSAREFLRLEQMQSFVAVVMWAQNRPLGMLGVSTRSDRQFSESDENLLIAIARQLATTIEKVRLYEETSRAYADLRQAQEQLLQSEKMSAIGQLMSGVAHELNNPLTAILGYTQLLEPELQTERGKEFVLKLYKQAQRTHRVVQNLLSFARQRKPAKTQVDLRAVIEDTLMLRDYDLKLNNIEIRRSYQDDLPLVLADAHQLEQVFLNIVNNGVDAILEIGPKGYIEVRSYTEGNYVCIEFHDSGPGIKDLKRVFDPFYTTKKIGKGTGLGLSICYGIVKEHGGNIVASNHTAGGAVFQVRLPIASATDAVVAPAKEQSSGRLAGRVLLVESEEAVLEFEREVLHGAGAEVTICSNSQNAHDLLTTETFDIIILGMQLSGGWSAEAIYHWLRTVHPGMEKRVIFTASHVQDSAQHQFLESTGAAYLVKPFNVEDLIATVRQHSVRIAVASK
ncbi:MAG TPA: GAF domain-containing protein [Candidatus Acidoferrales bacterium]|nr:GAF domain-containing protein [Candidatus Acidoferrales bacterium]